MKTRILLVTLTVYGDIPDEALCFAVESTLMSEFYASQYPTVQVYPEEVRLVPEHVVNAEKKE